MGMTEAFLLRHPKVAEVAVLGVPDRYFGEELLAAVRPKSAAGEESWRGRDSRNS